MKRIVKTFCIFLIMIWIFSCEQNSNEDFEVLELVPQEKSFLLTLVARQDFDLGDFLVQKGNAKVFYSFPQQKIFKSTISSVRIPIVPSKKKSNELFFFKVVFSVSTEGEKK